jgi:hypothetical protein
VGSCQPAACSPGYARCAAGCCPITPINPAPAGIVDYGTRGGFEAIEAAIDAQGRPHLVYFAGRYCGADVCPIRHAWREDGRWILERVAVLEYLSGLSMALDAAGRPHIVYGDDNADAVYYTWFDGAQWQTETVAVANDAWGGELIDMALDARGDVHVVYLYRDPNTHAYEMRYAVRSSGSGQWTEQTVVAGRSKYLNIALDSAGMPHIAYYAYGADDLRFGAFDGTSWSIEDVDTAGDVGAMASLVLDAADVPHISYIEYGSGDGDLKYATRSGAGWSARLVDPGDDVDGPTSIVVDSRGRPSISYYVETDYPERGLLRRARWSGATWIVRDVVVGAYNWPYSEWLGQYPVQVMDASDTPHIAYTSSEGELYFTSSTGTNIWSEDVVEGDYTDTPGVGYRSSMALDVRGRPHLVYRRPGSLAYAHWDGARWLIELLDPSGSSADIALDSAGRPHISFLDGAALKYMRFDGARWRSSVIGGQADGPTTSIILDVRERPIIAWRDASSEEIKVSRWDGLAWNTQVLGTSGNYGGYPNLVLDARGRPQVTFGDSVGDELHYAAFDGQRWTTSIVADPSSMVSAMAHDSSGRAHVVYTTGTSDLMHSWRDAAGWHPEYVDTVSDIDGLLDLALDTQGYPHIVYVHDDSGSRIKYAYFDGSIWNLASLADTRTWYDESGSYRSLLVRPAIAVDANDNAHIAYYTDEQRLWYAP